MKASKLFAAITLTVAALGMTSLAQAAADVPPGPGVHSSIIAI